MLYTILGTMTPWLLVGVGAWLLFELIKLCGRVLLRLDALDEQMKTLLIRPAASGLAPAPRPAGLLVGNVAPAFELSDLAGTPHSLAEFNGRRVLLIFFNPKCGHCVRMAEALAKVSPEGSDDRPLPLVVSAGSVEDNRALVEKYGLKCRLLLQGQTEVSGRYLANGTPMAYLIDAAGKIASPRTTGADAILALASGQVPSAQGSAAAPPDLPLGSPAPVFELADLGGNQRSLAEFKGRRILVIFFSPQCGFCTRMADDLAKLSLEGGVGHVLPLLISAGSAEDNQSMVDEYGLRCPLLLQQETAVATQYRCSGTPMGYLIDEQGNIASPKASGAESLLAHCLPKVALSETPASVPAAVDAARNGHAKSGRQPCAKCKDGKTPCGSCSEKKAAANDLASPVLTEAQSYDVVEMRNLESVDAMVEELLCRADGSLRLVIIHGDENSDAMNGSEAAALRRFLRQRSDWLVSYQPTSASRFLVLSRDPRDRKALPSLLTKAANFAKALSLHVADGASKVTAEQMERRLEICTLCDRRSGDHCSACGCDLPTKAGWRTTLCPLGKWPVMDKAPVK